MGPNQRGRRPSRNITRVVSSPAPHRQEIGGVNFVVRRLLRTFRGWATIIVVDKQNPRNRQHTPRLPGQIFKLLFQPAWQWPRLSEIHPRQIRARAASSAGVREHWTMPPSRLAYDQGGCGRRVQALNCLSDPSVEPSSTITIINSVEILRQDAFDGPGEIVSTVIDRHHDGDDRNICRVI